MSVGIHQRPRECHPPTDRIVDHCIETLRLNLMCQSDIGIFTFRTYPEYGYESDDYWPDFSTMHTCRNFEDIRKWAIQKTVAWDHDV